METGRVSMSLPRKDKKREVKAPLPAQVRQTLEERAEKAGLSPSAYAHKLTMVALEHEKVIRAFSPFFKRGYCVGSRAFIGRVITPSIDALMPDGNDVTRFPVKFPPSDHLKLGELAYAFSCSLSQALCILISESILQDISLEQVVEV